MAIYDYRIGVGYNVALGSLTNIEDITPTNDIAFAPPNAISTYSPGIRRTRTDSRDYFAGKKTCSWVFSMLTWKQVEYLMDTYCNSLYDGPVTIYTRAGRTTYARFNALMKLPIPVEANRELVVYRDYRVTFIDLVAL